MLAGQADILVQVDGLDLREVQIALSAALDQDLIGADGGGTGGQTQHAVRLHHDLSGQDICGEHDQSYRYFMNNNLFNHINIDKANTNVPNGLAEDVDAECARYNDVINTLGPIDIQVLGMGHNGHIGFNEPDDHFPLETHKVDLAQSTIDANARFFASADEVPRQALTMGIKTIMQAKKVLVVVSGKDKAEIVKKAFTGPVTPQVPASILQMHADVILVADEAAASLL